MPGYDEHQMIKPATYSQSQVGFCKRLFDKMVWQLIVESQAGLTNTGLFEWLIVMPGQETPVQHK